MKECTRCLTTKCLEEFKNEVRVKDGKTSRCKECIANGAKNFKSRQPKHRWLVKIKHKYGLTESDYNEKLESQGLRCAICALHISDYKHATMKRFSVDHDHVTGKVRGLLCNRCNQGIGLLDDSALVCSNASLYLDIHSEHGELTDG